VTIQGFTLRRAVYNIFVKDAAKTRILNNFFNVCRRYHIYMEGASEAEIAENRSRVGRYNVLTMRDSHDCLVRDNYHYEDPCGYMATESHRNTFLRNHFDSLSWYGITLINSNDNLIEDNLFHHGRILGFQIRQGGEGNRVVKNTFYGNRTEAILMGNAAKNNIIAQNNILANRGLSLTNESGSPVEAARNWWGATDGPGGAGPGSGDEVDGRVRFEPWLKAPVKNSWTDWLNQMLTPAQ
jgi:parallel beta-helix repeat protein